MLQLTLVKLTMCLCLIHRKVFMTPETSTLTPVEDVDLHENIPDVDQEFPLPAAAETPVAAIDTEAPLTSTPEQTVNRKQTVKEQLKNIFSHKKEAVAVATAAAVATGAGAATAEQTVDQNAVAQAANRPATEMTDVFPEDLQTSAQALAEMGILTDEQTKDPEVLQALQEVAAEYAASEGLQTVVVNASDRDLSGLGLKPSSEGTYYLDRTVKFKEAGPDGNEYGPWAMLQRITEHDVQVEAVRPTLYRFTAQAEGASFTYAATRDPNTQGDKWQTYKYWEGDGNIAADPYLTALSESARANPDARLGLFLDGPAGTTTKISVFDQAGQLISTQEITLNPLVTEGGSTHLQFGAGPEYQNAATDIQWAAETPLVQAETEAGPANQVLVVDAGFTGTFKVEVTDLQKEQTCNFWYGDAIVEHAPPQS